MPRKPASLVSCSGGPPANPPTRCATASSREKRFTTSSTTTCAAATLFSSAGSATNRGWLKLAALILRETPTTVAPASRNARVTLLPRPPPAPVIRTLFPCMRFSQGDSTGSSWWRSWWRAGGQGARPLHDGGARPFAVYHAPDAARIVILQFVGQPLGGEILVADWAHPAADGGGSHRTEARVGGRRIRTAVLHGRDDFDTGRHAAENEASSFLAQDVEQGGVLAKVRGAGVNRDRQLAFEPAGNFEQARGGIRRDDQRLRSKKLFVQLAVAEVGLRVGGEHGAGGAGMRRGRGRSTGSRDAGHSAALGDAATIPLGNAGVQHGAGGRGAHGL